MPPKGSTPKAGKAKMAAAADMRQSTLSFGVRLIMPNNLDSPAQSKRQRVDASSFLKP